MSEEERNFEQEARKDGWVPRDEWKGPEEKWTEAQTFVENGEKIAGIAVKKARKLEETVETLQSQIDEIQATKREFVEFNTRALERERKEKAALIAKLEEQQVEAINQGDGETYLQTKRKIQEIQSEPEQRAGQQEWAKKWASENPWYAKDTIARGVANAVAEEMRKQGVEDNGKDFLDEVARRTKEALPNKFENPNRKKGITGGEGKESDETAPAGQHSYENLDAEAKAACDRFVAEGLMTKKQYIDTYAW